jgi:hypothetical protein
MLECVEWVWHALHVDLVAMAAFGHNPVHTVTAQQPAVTSRQLWLSRLPSATCWNMFADLFETDGVVEQVLHSVQVAGIA